jgi:hypothetical protein
MDLTTRSLCSAFLFGLTVAATAVAEPRFTGTTIVDATLKRDVLHNIGMILHAKFKCDSLEIIDTQGLPAAHPEVWLPPGAGPATYERWTVTACSHVQPFLVVSWAAKEGGTMFQVKAEKVAES